MAERSSEPTDEQGRAQTCWLRSRERSVPWENVLEG